MKHPLLLCGGAIALTSALALAQARTHDLKLLPQNVHWGYYDAAVKPVLRIASGDTVRIETMIARGLQRLRAAGVKEEEIPESLKLVERTITERGPGAHPMTGPIFVEGAEPGDVLEVKIVAFEFLHPYGVSGFIPGSGTLPEEFPYVKFHLVRFDERAGTASFAPGVTLKLAPFFGSIGVAPNPLVGRISSGPPGPHAGNLDNKELVAGSTLYIPVAVPGALLSLGDGHAMQGDGEATLTALETSLRGTVQITVRKGMHLKWPRGETPTHYIAMGLHTDLDEAAKLAVKEMIDFLVTEKKMNRDEAYILCSVAVDLHVTQLVDGTKGVHAMLAKSMFAQSAGAAAAAYMGAADIAKGLSTAVAADAAAGAAVTISPGTVVRRRIGAGEPQYAILHPSSTEIYYIVEGAGSLVTGGSLKMPLAPSTDPDVVRSKAIEGGVTRKVGKGDVIVVPPGTPHWFNAIDGTIIYLESRVRVK